MARRTPAIGTLIGLLLSAVAVGPVVADDGKPRRPDHVIVVAMDNYHLEDIQGHMPNLLAFLERGALSTASHHPDLPTRTAPDFSTIVSGEYPDRHGVINNGFLAPTSRPGFAYWENIAGRSPPTFLSPPPWKAFNWAGWDIGAVGMEGLVLEQADEVKAYLGLDRQPTQEELDQYTGTAIHWADGSASLGAAEIPAIAAEFPEGWRNGWGGPPKKNAPITLRMTTLLQAAGVRFTYSYVENVHSRCGQVTCENDLPRGNFDDLLEADDAAFARFFADLAQLGITTANTLFVITTDEGDHYNADFARTIPSADLPQPIALGSDALFYNPDADALAAALSAIPEVEFIATRSAMRALHISDGRDVRTPTYFAFTDEGSTFSRAPAGRWNHGNINPDVTDVWLAIAGPGIKHGGLHSFTDQADLVPTIRWILGMGPADDADGVAITPAFAGFGDPVLLVLRAIYKELSAPLGLFGRAVLAISTAGVRGSSEDRAAADALIDALGARRDTIAAEIKAILEGRGAAPGQAGDAGRRGQQLLDEVGRI
jgi:hypothetical protein